MGTFLQQITVKVWKACTDRTSSSSKPTTGHGLEASDVLPHATRLNLVAVWTKRHGFVISGERLLSEQLIRKLHDGVHSEHVKLDIHLLDSLKLQSSLGGLPRLVMPAEFQPGKPIVPEILQAEAVQSSFQAFERIRAFWGTMSWVCVNMPAFFSYQDAVFAEDRCLELLQWTKDGQHPPLSHVSTAWALTMRHFSDSIRTTGRPLSGLVRETGTWVHFWQSWTPKGGAAPPSGGGAAGSNREAELARLLKQEQGRSQQLQQQADSLRKTQQKSLQQGGGREIVGSSTGSGYQGGGSYQGGGAGRGDRERTPPRQTAAPPNRGDRQNRGNGKKQQDGRGGRPNGGPRRDGKH